MQAFSLRNNEVMYPIIFAATGALGLALLFLCNSRIQAVVRQYFEPSKLTFENLKLQPILATEILFDLEEERRMQKVAGTIIALTKLQLIRKITEPSIEFEIGLFFHKSGEVDSGGWDRELSIKVSGEDSFFLCYAIAILDFAYKCRSYLNLFRNEFSLTFVLRNSCISVIEKAVSARSEEELHEILTNRYFMHSMVKWIKKMAQPDVAYAFNKKSVPQIEGLFEKVGLFVNVAKKEDEDFFFVTGVPKSDLEDVYVSEKASGELVQNENGTISYFSDS